MKKLPICVDLDGTYLKTDLLIETFLILLKNNFFYIFYLPFLLLKGKSYLKSFLAKHSSTHIDFKNLPKNEELRDILKKKKEDGHEIYIVSASNELLLNDIEFYDSIFSATYGSSDEFNLKGKNKAEFLKKKFPKGFIYAGDSKADIEVWKEAKQAIVVNADSCVVKGAKEVSEILTIVPKPDTKTQIKQWVQALRIYQCVKNLLLFLPLGLTHQLTDIGSLLTVILGFIVISVLAFSTYLFNDLIDLENDRAHWSKSKRPIASGDIWVFDAITVFAFLCVLSLSVSFMIDPLFGIGALCYFVTTMLYSLYFKKVAIIDVTILAFLFTLRIILGTILIDAAFSVWLLSFSFFFFLSLAVIKRVAELGKSSQKKDANNFGRGYSKHDQPFLYGIGMSSSISAVILMLLYLIDKQYLAKGYNYPSFLWGIPICVFLCSAKMWMEVLRKNMHDDPIIFAFTNRFCLTFILIAGTIFLLAGV